jgi:broad specificity phosphatase PhoE
MAQGTWEGLHLSEIRTRYPDQLSRWHSRPDLVRFPGGEALVEVERRTSGAFQDIFNQFPGGTVAVVSHSVVVQVVASWSLHIDLRFLHSIKISNASVTTLCGSSCPGKLLSLNVTQALYGSPFDSARAESCVGASLRRQTT